MKCRKFFLLYIFIFSFIKESYEQERKDFDDNLGTKSIIMNDKIFYIRNIENDYVINIYPETTISGTYDVSFKSNKDIIKKDNTNFVIIGLNENKYLYLQTFIFENDIIQSINLLAFPFIPENVIINSLMDYFLQQL